MPLTKDSHLVQKFDYMVNDEPKCPFCDEDIKIGDHELYELFDEGDHKITCPYCEKEVLVNTTVIHRFSTNYQPEFE